MSDHALVAGLALARVRALTTHALDAVRSRRVARLRGEELAPDAPPERAGAVAHGGGARCTARAPLPAAARRHRPARAATPRRRRAAVPCAARVRGEVVRAHHAPRARPRDRGRDEERALRIDRACHRNVPRSPTSPGAIHGVTAAPVARGAIGRSPARHVVPRPRAGRRSKRDPVG